MYLEYFCITLWRGKLKNYKYSFYPFTFFKSIKVFSNKLTKGTIIKKCEKYNTVLICPNSMKGDSTCLAPNCINIKKLATKI